MCLLYCHITFNQRLATRGSADVIFLSMSERHKYICINDFGVMYLHEYNPIKMQMLQNMLAL